MRAVLMLCLCLSGGMFGGAIEAPQPGVFHEPATGLTLRYPVELVVRDAQKRIDEGHVAVYGSMGTASKEHELARRCLRPILLADLPESSAGADQLAGGSDATLFFFEFNMSKECKAGFKYKTDELVAGGVAQTAIQLPGATALSPPLWFDLGKERLHITFAAFGLANPPDDQPHALLATAAMRYHGHTLGWMMSARQLNTFNDLTKSSIELDDGKVYPLVPFNLDERLRLPINVFP